MVQNFIEVINWQLELFFWKLYAQLQIGISIKPTIIIIVNCFSLVVIFREQADTKHDLKYFTGFNFQTEPTVY